MHTTVTAVLVARGGDDWLEHTLAGLRAQTHTPDRVVAVLCGDSASARAVLERAGVDTIVTSSGPLPFGEAVKRAELALPDPVADEWLWLLAEDSAPEPHALQHILTTVQRAPSVAVAGPKLVDWHHPERIIELGQSLTHSGERWLLRRQELDQQQYDHLQDVLGVGPVGMLVRRDVWRELGGFDPALPVYDDGLDFSVRARLAGYRVVVSPASRVRFAQRGIAGPRIDRSGRALRIAHRQARTAHLHRRIAYAPAVLAFFMWLGLPLLGVIRVLWALIRERPGNMLGEFSSALRVFFKPGAIIQSRRRIAQHNTAGWAAVRPLRVDRKSVRTARMIDREAILAAQGKVGRELHFVSSGGLTVLIVATVVSLALTWWVLPLSSVTGEALAPLTSFDGLWQATHTENGVPADPFAWVLAILGSLTFWNPSLAVVVFMVAALPLAALGGWIWGAQLTESPAGRALIGLGWALSPVLFGSLDNGRLPTLILAVVLPWLVLAASRCRESWSWAGTASLLAAVALACAPVLIPAALVLWVIGLFSSLRGISRVVATFIMPLALFIPKIAALNAPLDLVRDPGLTPAFTPGSPWHLMLGFPEFGLEGWAGWLDKIGLGGPPATLLVGVLFIPVVLLAVFGAVCGRVRDTVLHAVMGGLGLLTAVASAHVQLTSDGFAPVAVWTGSGLALYWIALLGLAGIGVGYVRRAAVPAVSVALVAAILAVLPFAGRLVTAQTGITAGDTQMPAIVDAAGTVDPTLRTLVLSSAGDRKVAVDVVSGAGVRLNQIRTEARADTVTPADEWLAETVAALASTGSDAILAEQLTGSRVQFVLLRAEGSGSERAHLQAAFDQNTQLTAAGHTDHGLLWRAESADGPDPLAPEQWAGPAGWLEAVPGMSTLLRSPVVWWIQVVIALAMALLALPTAEVTERPERRRRVSAGPTVATPGPGDSGGTEDTENTENTAAETGAGSEASVTEAGVADRSDSEAPNPEVADAGTVEVDPNVGEATGTANGETAEGGER